MLMNMNKIHNLNANHYGFSGVALIEYLSILYMSISVWGIDFRRLTSKHLFWIILHDWIGNILGIFNDAPFVLLKNSKLDLAFKMNKRTALLYTYVLCNGEI